MEKKFVSVVVYLHNDEKRIENFLDKVIPVVKDSFTQYELVCVNDGCTDGTIFKLKDYIAEHNLSGVVSIIHMGFYQGMESAMNAGRDVSIGDFVYEFDNVLVDYDPSLIFGIYEKMLEGFDLVAAATSDKISFTSRNFYKLYNKNSNSNGVIGTETFRIISRRAINRIKSMGSYIPYRKAVYANCGLNLTCVSYDSTVSVHERKKVKRESVNFFERTNLALDSFIYFTNIMEKISAVVSVLFLLFSLGMIIYTLIDHFVGGAIASGWASTMCFMSLGFFGVFMLLTIVLKYLSVLLNLVFRKTKYLVADIEKIVG